MVLRSNDSDRRYKLVYDHIVLTRKGMKFRNNFIINMDVSP
jgi:hypothetical protein